MPALPKRLKNKPFKPSSQLKHKRTHATLRKYAKRRAEYAAMKSLCLCVFLLHFAPALHDMHITEVRERERHMSKLRQRVCRKRKKLVARKARIEERMLKVKAKLEAAHERILLREVHLRRHATAHAGFLAGWNSTSDMSSEEAKTYTKRYVRAFIEARTERARIESLMNTQRKPVTQPVTIRI